MRGLLRALGVVAAVLFCATASPAQLNPPNDMGVTIGHMHLNVHDVEAAKKFYLELGGTAIRAAPSKPSSIRASSFFSQRRSPAEGRKAQR